KYHWQHMRLLRALAPERTRERVRLAARLGDMLGERHDLDLLADRLDAGRAALPDAAMADRLAGMARERAGRLGAKAAKLGARLFAEKPAAFAQDWRDVWREWDRARERLRCAAGANG